MSPGLNYVAVLVTTAIIFMLGGLWYSPVLFANRWVALQGRGARMFSYQPRALWMIDTGYNLVSMVIAGVILAVWR